jgi:FAD-dependent oxidoreductase domain-containing protein 1
MSRKVETLIIGGGIIGSAIAYFLARQVGGRDIVVLEPDEDYKRASTPRSASAIRTQFHLGINVAMSRHGYDFFKNATENLSVNGEEIDISFEDCPYLVLSAPEGVSRMRKAHGHQLQNGANVDFLLPNDLREHIDWLKTDGIGAATLGRNYEGWFEPMPALRSLRRKAESLGVTYIPEKAVDMEVNGSRVSRVHLNDGQIYDVTTLVNAAGAQAGRVSALANVSIPIEARKRSAFVFRTDHSPNGFMNFVDPTFASRGIYARPYRGQFMAVTSPAVEDDPDTDNLEVDLGLFEEIIRPALARRVHGFERIELVDAWAGHYEINTFDQNAIIGRHPQLTNLVFACGLSGHGVMHAPSIGRGIAELLTTGSYQTLDLTPFRFERIAENAPLDDVQPSEHRDTAAGV